MDTITCAHCDILIATHFTDLSSPEDPCCNVCYDAYWTECESCGKEVRQSDTGDRLVRHASMGGPAEYDQVCIYCAPDAEECDWDRVRDEQEGL